MKIAVSVSEKEKARGKESPYWRALVAAGARPGELELVAAQDGHRYKAEDFDGVLLAGGEDVDPALYGEKKRYENVNVNRARDEFELSLLDRAQENALPVLGICRGAQVVNVKFGGTLYQDLKMDSPLEIDHKQAAPRNEPTHGLTLTDSESRLAEAFQGSCRVNSMHHQAIRRVGRGLKVVAYSEDGLVEAVEAADQPFFLAVQWHPEEMVDRPEQRKIFERFLESCRDAAERRKHAKATS